ncbi:thioester reductase domain-containing protein [Amycolatopsis sp. H20-H5]|uniref:thioester reductase domain-containing protein n=1 Tax=Amycolatopsis sp. H20-H5 TaxID=3046309 RepID=UPI002DBF20BB|nr:thioester reductase domain-containing protein [Amycolatopsis sp. H20-H5]MEC3975524.1 thioester reductase domain-containing protein [Amycolatopsis sp. H20-H5]
MKSGSELLTPDLVRGLLVQEIASYLETPPSEIKCDILLSEYGLDSVYALAVCAAIEDRFELSLDPVIMWDYPTVDALADLLVGLIAGGLGGRSPGAIGEARSLPAGRLAQEAAALPADIVPGVVGAPVAQPPYQAILVTGATGFAGGFLLHELLTRSSAVVFTLVRAQDGTDALNRVRKNLDSYGLWDDSFESRLTGVAGDLALPRLGVSDQDYEKLSEQIEMIVHNGAVVSFVQSYDQLKPANVLGTTEILRLACRGRMKPVHFVSSMGVHAEPEGVHHYPEAPLPEDPGCLVGGYRQSKWVADRLVSAAGERGLPVSIYRPGNIMGAQTTGVVGPDQIVNALLKGCLQLGVAPEWDIQLLLVPVDFFAAATAHNALAGRAHGRVYHLPGARPVPWHDVIGMLTACGYPVRRVLYRDWLRQVRDAGPANAMAPYLPLFGADAPSADLATGGHHPRVETAAMAGALHATGITCRAVDQELLGLYLGHLAATGYLTPPARLS